MPKFVPGLELSRRYYKQVVSPILNEAFPGLNYSAGLVGSGSEVLGYDTLESTDHNWGLRLHVFLKHRDWEAKRSKIDSELRRKLPTRFLGYPTSFGAPDERGVRLPEPRRRKGETNHYISFVTVRSFFEDCLGVDPFRTPGAATWLVLPQQRLLEVTS